MANKEKKRATILIVDDEPRVVRLLSMMLREEGYEVLQGYSGEAALEATEKESPDLILLDIMMPGIDGYEVCQKLRETEQTKAIPIIMITALEGIDEKVKALNLGADEFISKPFNKLELLARIRTLLRVKYLHDELARANQKLLEQHKVLEGERKIAREVQEGVTSSLPLPLIRD